MRPLVSCVMPTANRRRWVLQAIRYFQRQTYPNAELVIVDDGADGTADFIAGRIRGDSRIRYIAIPPGRTLGAKRNLCVELSRGELILHWDDDDWMAPHRIACQVEALERAQAEVCGLSRILFYDASCAAAWLYDYPQTVRPWLAGGSLLYTRDFWRPGPFPDVQVASDTHFIWNRSLGRAAYVEDFGFYVAMIHPGNTSPKGPADSDYWKPWPGASVERLLGADLAFYRSGAAPAAAGTGAAPPEYAILMVVSNARAMTQMATLRTLRHIAGQNARLLVVDNASHDGAGDWLHMLHARGDIDLIRNASNIGHGPALELARHATRSPYLVTLDSDAFPISNEWLRELRARLDAGGKVAGILHHRDYIHPSCLMVARATLDEFALTLLNEKDRPSQLDVAERISCEVKRRGFRIAGLTRTADRRRGSISEPIYLGAQYEGLVHHQWYTTRAATAGGAPVDDVPQEALDRSLGEVLAAWRAEPCDVAVVVGIRGRPGEADRIRNAQACLRALNLQDLPRSSYRIVVVEQDDSPHLERLLAPLADQYIFLPNSGPYNRAWCFNAGAAQVAAKNRALCLMDADLLIAPDFLRRGLGAFEQGARAVLPYTEVLYLDAHSTARAIAAATGQFDGSYTGQLFTTSQGGCIWIEPALYTELGGHDERFRGWGREDRELWNRLSSATRIEILPGRMLHLDHARPVMDDEWAMANQRLLESLERNQTPVWRGPMDRTPPAAAPARDWENWHRWDARRIERIVGTQWSAARSLTARLVVRYGASVLDAGCGPGAMWPYFHEARPGVSLKGVDITAGMLEVAHRLFRHVPVCRADCGKLPLASGSVDVVLLRHVLEHLPDWLMESVLCEAMRVARRAVVAAFHIPPADPGRPRETCRAGDNFLETRWAPADLEAPLEQAGWRIGRRIPPPASCDDYDTVWVLEPLAVEPVAEAAAEPFKFSIVMPTYRRPHTIQRAVASIRAQTYQAWELIVVDNAGDANYRFDDSRIQVYRHAEQVSASYARNQGLRYATGDLVCFFDDDDEMFADYLHRFAALFLSHPRVKMARCGMLISEGLVNRSYATPECCVRREFATASWTNRSTSHDQIYFKSIAAANGWSEAAGDIVSVEEALCRAYTDPHGGLRGGWL